MTHSCDFDVAVRVIASNGTTVLVDFNDHAKGLSVVSTQEPEESVRAITTSAPRVNGAFRVAEADEGGILQVVVLVEGSTWAQCSSRWQAARTAYRSESYYFVETETEGVTTRWRAYRPDVAPGPVLSTSLAQKRQTYVLRFQTQPNPTVT